jgi:asparagine synthase (glutamine-hydrolysing)
VNTRQQLRRAVPALRRLIGRLARRVAPGLAARVSRRLHPVPEARPPAAPVAAAAGADVGHPVRIGPAGAETNPEFEPLIAGVMAENLSYLGVAALRTLAQAVREVEAAGVPGLLVETGTALGGSAIVMAAAKSPDRPMRVYDVFGMIPPPGERDGEDVHERYETITRGESTGLGGEQYYGYRSDLLGEVTASFARHGVPVAENNVELVAGLFEDTLVVDGPVALAHLDGDWYESTMTCLTRIAPRLSPGGRLVIDDYDAWSGCRTAVDEYFGGRAGFRFERRGKLHIVRI